MNCTTKDSISSCTGGTRGSSAGVIEEIRSTKAKRMGKVQDVKYFLEGVRKAEIDFEKIAVGFEGLNVTSPVNNTGAFMIRPGRAGVLVPLRRYTVLTVQLVSYRFEEWTEEHMGQAQANSLFSPSPGLTSILPRDCLCSSNSRRRSPVPSLKKHPCPKPSYTQHQTFRSSSTTKPSSSCTSTRDQMDCKR